MAELNELINSLNQFKSRSQTRKSLEKLGPSQAGAALIEYVSDENVKDNAIWAVVDIFTEWKWKGAAETLVSLLETRIHLQGDIIRALEGIIGIQLGVDIDAWKKIIHSPGLFVSLRAAFVDTEILDFVIVENYCKIYLPIPGGRKHEVLVYEEEARLKVYTECGFVEKIQVPAVEEYSKTMERAELSCHDEDGRTKVVIKSEWGDGEIDYQLLKDEIIYLARIADNLEEQLTGEDNI